MVVISFWSSQCKLTLLELKDIQKAANIKHALTDTHAHAHVHTHTHAHTHIYMHAHTYTHMHAKIYKHTQSQILLVKPKINVLYLVALKLGSYTYIGSNIHQVVQQNE